jgi:hypothetical protein
MFPCKKPLKLFPKHETLFIEPSTIQVGGTRYVIFHPTWENKQNWIKSSKVTQGGKIQASISGFYT